MWLGLIREKAPVLSKEVTRIFIQLIQLRVPFVFYTIIKYKQDMVWVKEYMDRGVDDETKSLITRDLNKLKDEGDESKIPMWLKVSTQSVPVSSAEFNHDEPRSQSVIPISDPTQSRRPGMDRG